MSANHIISAFEALYDFGNKSKIIEPDSLLTIQSVISSIKAKKESFTRGQTPSWQYQIPPNRPIKLIKTERDGYWFSVDIFCNFSWIKGDMPSSQELVLRIWSDDPKLIFRPDFDAAHFEEKATGSESWRRVMFRCHFDKANKDQDGPHYHLQIGGKPESDEFHWFPHKISLPRLTFPPTDFFLLFQLVMKNYYPEQYKRLAKEQSWIYSFYPIQKLFLLDYFQNCVKTLESGNTVSLLDSLWNKKEGDNNG